MVNKARKDLISENAIHINIHGTKWQKIIMNKSRSLFWPLSRPLLVANFLTATPQKIKSFHPCWQDVLFEDKIKKNSNYDYTQFDLEKWKITQQEWPPQSPWTQVNDFITPNTTSLPSMKTHNQPHKIRWEIWLCFDKTSLPTLVIGELGARTVETIARVIRFIQSHCWIVTQWGSNWCLYQPSGAFRRCTLHFDWAPVLKLSFCVFVHICLCSASVAPFWCFSRWSAGWEGTTCHPIGALRYVLFDYFFFLFWGSNVLREVDDGIFFPVSN